MKKIFWVSFQPFTHRTAWNDAAQDFLDLRGTVHAFPLKYKVMKLQGKTQSLLSPDISR